MIIREEFMQEMKLRLYIRKILREKKFQEKKRDLLKEYKEEQELREAIRQVLINEAKPSPVKFKNTGLNALQTVLKKIIPIVREDYESLTSNSDQRKSFRAHIINGVKNALAPIRSIQKGQGTAATGDEGSVIAFPGKKEPDDKIDKPSQMQEQNLKDLEPDEKVIDIENTEKDSSKDKKERAKQRAKDNFDLPGEDRTGRNFARDSFKKIEKILVDEYMKLDNEEDREIFYDWLLINMKTYFDIWEDSIQTTPIEPDAPEDPQAVSTNI